MSFLSLIERNAKDILINDKINAKAFLQTKTIFENGVFIDKYEFYINTSKVKIGDIISYENLKYLINNLEIKSFNGVDVCVFATGVLI